MTDSSEHAGLSLNTSRLEGKQLGPYLIQTLIAEGGMGSVYMAYHKGLQRQVALKTLLANATSDSDAVQRFLTEARVVAKIQHPNVVPVYDAGELAGLRYMAMEFVPGKTLAERLRETGVLDPYEAAALTRDIASGLQAAHVLRILHRDVKPANVILSGDGARLTDFGIARVEDTDRRLTKSDSVLGTPNYMAPEQAEGGVLDVRTDVYGVGAMLYQCLTGNPPFVRGSHLATLQAVVSDPVALPRAERPDLSRDLEAICLQCLEKDPLVRYQTIGELIADLERFLAGDQVEARPLGALEGALRTVRTNSLLVGTTAVVTLVFCLMGLALLLPALRARSAVQLEEQTRSWREGRLEQMAADADDAQGEQITELARNLEWDAFEAAARSALAPGGRPGQIKAVGRGLGDRTLFEAEVAPTVAALRLRQATGDGRFARLAEACVADPEGTAGRRARLELAKALALSDLADARAMAKSSLLRLVAKDDAVGLQSRLALARFHADRRDFDGLAALAASLQEAEALTETEREEANLLAGLAATFRPAIDLPAHRFAAVIEHGGRPTLALGQAHGIDLYALNDLVNGKLPKPHRSWRHTGSEELAFMGRGPSGGLMGVIANTANVRVCQINLDAPTGTNPLVEVKVFPAATGEFAAIAAGDVNGDSVDDVLVAYRELGGASVVVLGGVRPAVVPLYPQDPDNLRFLAIETAAFADLDGDGRDEVVIGPSTVTAPFVDVRVLGAAGTGFRSRGHVELAGVERLVAMPGGRSLLAVVDYGREALTRESTDVPWLGRDGVYLIEDVNGEPALSGRWTFGPDRLPTTADRQAVGDVDAWPLRLDSEPWIARTSRTHGDSPWLLELLPVFKLRSLDNNEPPALAIRAANPPPNMARGLVGNLDGDGSAEIVLGGRLLGFGEAPIPTWTAPEPRPAESRPQRLLEVTRFLHALGADGAAPFLAELRTRYPDSWATRAASLSEASALVSEAEETRRNSFRAFKSGDRDRGIRLREEAQAAFVRAAEMAETLGEEPSADTLRCLTLAAHGWRRARDFPRAQAALLRALKLDLAPDERNRLTEELRSHVVRGRGSRLEVGFGAAAKQAVVPLHPLRTRLEEDGAVAIASGESIDGVFVPIKLRPRPLTVEADVVLAGEVWSAFVQVGVFEWGLGGNPVRPTGFHLELWNVATRQITVRPILSGRVATSAIGCTVEPTTTRLSLRLDVTPIVGGGSEIEFEVADEDTLLYAGHAIVDGAGPSGEVAGPAFLGMGLPVASNAALYVDQGGYAVSGPVTLERVAVTAWTASTVAPTGLLAAHGHLLAGRLKRARQAYHALLMDTAVALSTRQLARFYRGFVRGRLGEPGPERDLITFAKQNPYEALLLFEELAEGLPHADPADAKTVAAALLKLRDGDEPLLAAIARSLLGDYRAVHQDPVRGPARLRAQAYLHMRAARRKDRYQTSATYRELVPKGRFPRHGFPQVIGVLDPPPDEGAYRQLLEITPDFLQNYVNAWRAWLARPTSSAPAYQLGHAYGTQRRYGVAVKYLRMVSLERITKTERLTVLSSIAECYYQMRRTEPLFGVLQELLDAGLPPAKLKAYEPVYRDDPRFQALVEKAKD